MQCKSCGETWTQRANGQCIECEIEEVKKKLESAPTPCNFAYDVWVLDMQVTYLQLLLEKERAAVAHFLAPHRFNLSESWLDFFEEEGIVTFNEIGYAEAAPVPFLTKHERTP